MVTMSSTRRARRSDARSEYRAAGDQREPFAGIWLAVAGCDASLMYLSRADSGLGCSFFLSLGAATATAQRRISAVAHALGVPRRRSRRRLVRLVRKSVETSLDTARRVHAPRVLIALPPDLFRLPVRESLFRLRDCGPGSSIPLRRRIPRGLPV